MSIVFIIDDYYDTGKPSQVIYARKLLLLPIDWFYEYWCEIAKHLFALE